MGSDELKSDFVVTSAGQHQICFQNMQNRVSQVYIHIKTGELAETRVQEITRQHLLPVEAQAIRVNQMIQRLRSELSELVKSEVQLSEQNDSIKSRVMIFGVISLLVMGISTFLQVKYLKNFFRHKKII